MLAHILGSRVENPDFCKKCRVTASGTCNNQHCNIHIAFRLYTTHKLMNFDQPKTTLF